ncbi:MAG: hypothetical protein ABFD83_06745 [Armatimonadota bacterium]
MRTLGLVLAGVLIFGGAAFATDVTFDMYSGGYETVSCPVVAINPEPSAVFNGLDFENGSPSLSRFDAVTKGMVTYDYWSQPDAAFGGILLGDGYQVWNDGAGSGTNTISDYIADGVPSAGLKTDMWISLPKAGWSLIGVPYNTPVVIEQETGEPIYFTDGKQMLRWDAAVGAGWLGDNIQRFNGAGWTLSGFQYVDEDQLTPGKGYYIYTNIDNLAMVIKAQN